MRFVGNTVLIAPLLAVVTYAAGVSGVNAAELDEMFDSLGPAYSTMEGAKACRLEPQIGGDMMAYATQLVTKLEQNSKLSPAARNALLAKAASEAPMLETIGACPSVLAAFQILGAQRKILSARAPVTTQGANEQKPAVQSEAVKKTASGDASSSGTMSTSTQLPIAAGAYVQSAASCEQLRKNELDIINFDVQPNRKAFSTGGNLCVISSVTDVNASRSKVDADCTEVGELSHTTFLLDQLPGGNIRVDGNDLLYCSILVKAQPTQASSSGLIKQWTKLTIACRGGSLDDPNTVKQCDARADVSEKLGALGYCYEGESTATSEWRRCSSDAAKP